MNISAKFQFHPPYGLLSSRANSIGMLHCPSVVCPPFSKMFFSKTAAQAKPNFIWSLSGMGERKFVREV